jgi:hypothetical protein
MNQILEKILLSPELCKQLIDIFESDEVIKITRDKQYGNCGQEGIVRHELIPKEFFSILTELNLKQLEFKDIVHVFMVRRYRVGDSFPEHRDNNTLNYSNINSRREHRYKTFIFQLSNPADYIGGDLVIGEHIAGSELGNCISFHAGLSHHVTEVTSGIRYTALFWAEVTDFLEPQKIF